MRLTLEEVLGKERGGGMYDRDWLEDRVRQHLDGRIERAAVMVAEEDEIVGHTIVRVDADESGAPIGLFSTIFVVPEHRRIGVAGSLIRAGEAWMRRQAMATARTYTAVDNTPLHRLFERHGYSIVAERGEFAILSRSLAPSFRLAEETDAVLVAELGAKTFFDAYIGQSLADELHEYNREHFTPALMSRLLADHSNTVVIAADAGTPIGYAQLTFGAVADGVDGRAPVEIVRFYLVDSAKGQRLGDSLMAECLRIARDRNADVAWLSVWDENPVAIRFYERQGFAIVGHKTFEFAGRPDPSLIMARQIR